MKYLLLLMLFISTPVWASCPTNLAPTEYQGNQGIATKSATVCSVTYSYNGVVAGTYINLYDSLSASGTIRLTLVAATTAGSIIKEYPYGAYFGTGVYYKEINHSGTISTDIQSF